MQFEAISYNLPANPSRYRVATWKKLRELGAVYLQDGVAMVPAQAVCTARWRSCGRILFPGTAAPLF